MNQKLKRQVGVVGATLLGLGSILGTGVFVSIALATELTGPWTPLCVLLAAAVATCNGMSSAQLAANHPVSGGTYEYGYRWLTPTLGFTAGWLFLCAKSASAATAALGLAGYLRPERFDGSRLLLIPSALALLGLITLVVITGLRRSTRLNFVLVSVTIVSLLVFVVVVLAWLIQTNTFSHDQTDFDRNALPASPAGRVSTIFQSAALLFVAFTGYGRIATMGEEITEPRRNIPRTIIITLVISTLLYVSVAFVVAPFSFSLRNIDPFTRSAPLSDIANSLPSRAWLPLVVKAGAITAMAGVLLNLLLGLSRVVLAMSRRRDLPTMFSRLNARADSPTAAVLLMAGVISLLTLIGDVRVTWSLSAVTVLVYYSLTNLAALKLSAEERLYPRWISAVGLVGCLSLAVAVDWRSWVIAVGLVAMGFILRFRFGRASAHPSST